MLKKLLVLFSLFVPVFSFAKPIPVEHFSRGDEYANVKLSPGGTYLSTVMKNEGKNVLAILRLKDFSVSFMVSFGDNAQVGDYAWVNDKRVVISKEYLKGWSDHPQYYGELFGVDADGGNAKYLVGYHGEQQTGSRIKKATPLYGTSYILDPMPQDKRFMLITTYPWTATNEPHTVVYRVDVRSGVRRQVTKSPSRMAQFLTDHQGEVRFAASTDDYVDQKLYIRDLETGLWNNFETPDYHFSNVTLHAFDGTGDIVYATASVNDEAEGLYKINLKENQVALVYKEKGIAPSKIWVDDGNKELFAMEYESGYPTYAFVDGKAPMTQRLKGLLGALQGNQVRITSSSRDGKLSVVWAGSDINPGAFYLYRADSNQLQYLFSAKSWLDIDKLASTKPIQFKSRDGLQIHGYLTLPLGKKEKNLPLVVMPHGGPHGPRDWWEYDSNTQLLASRGIAVLKVNFRGSGGFGPAFEAAGYQKWGAEIQYDILDGVNYVIDQGYANKDNICIMGASFGGYSALQSAIISPDLFKCAIGVVGVYDLPLMFKEGDVQSRRSGMSYLKRVLGTDQDMLKAYSPSYNIDKLKAPVLIVHGGNDQRAPIEQAESLIKSLDEHKHPYQYMLLEDEGHGFYKSAHREKYYNRVLAFLEQHLTL